MKGPRKSLLASSILAIPSLAQALGLGGIEVKSGLNEPLVAEIQVIQSGPGEADGLAVALASADDFARVGIDRGRIDTPLEFTVGKSSVGLPIILVSTAKPVREPFLNFLLEVNWSKGRLLREYTVLLDPPVSAPARGSVVASTPIREQVPVPQSEPMATEPEVSMTPPPVVETPPPIETPPPVAETPPPVASELEAEPAPFAAEPAPMPEPAPATEAPSMADTAPTPTAAPAPAPAGDYGPIGQGETLWEIAVATRPSGVSDMNQFMITLLRMNPDSFYEQNINALKRGAILRIPSADEVNAVSTAEASSAVSSQNELWRGYQSGQAANPTRLADAGASESLRTPAEATANTGSRLELLPPRAGDDQGAADRPGSAGLARSGEEVKNLRGDLARSQEDLESSRQEVSELRSRLTDVESIKVDQTKMLALRNDELKSLQQRAAELEAKVRELEAARAASESDSQRRIREAEAAAAAATATAAAATDAAAASDAAAAAARLLADKSSSDVPEETADIWTQPDATTPATDTTVPADIAVLPDSGTPTDAGDVPAADGSTSTDTSTVASDASGKPADSLTPIDSTPTDASVEPVPEPAPVVSEPVSSEPVPVSASGGMLSNPLVLGGIVAALLALLGLLWSRMRRKRVDEPNFVPTTEEDDRFDAFPPSPLAPVDNAEDDLLDQIAMNPADLSARLKLLELYHARGDAAEFESTARALRAQIASEDQYEWQEATRLAASIVPGHALFVRRDEFPQMDATFSEPEIEAPAAAADPLDGGLDFSAFEEASTAPPKFAGPATREEPNFDFSFDLEEPTQTIEPVRTQPIAPVAQPSRNDDSDLSFDFDMDVPSIKAPEQAPVEQFKVDLPDIDFGSMEVTSKIPPDIEPIAVSSSSSMDDELGDLGVFGDDAVATKLDLARAYMDMGDPDGARSMLDEVISEGNSQQQDEARKLLDGLR